MTSVTERIKRNTTYNRIHAMQYSPAGQQPGPVGRSIRCQCAKAWSLYRRGDLDGALATMQIIAHLEHPANTT